ncbi:unnamed protein product [Ectocarpus sp. CCAP 1310/34]|nr:unnamed protein product [Ectocarpus sp. CCAP 1310/34]
MLPRPVRRPWRSCVVLHILQSSYTDDYPSPLSPIADVLGGVSLSSGSRAISALRRSSFVPLNFAGRHSLMLFASMLGMSYAGTHWKFALRNSTKKMTSPTRPSVDFG